MKNFVHKLIGKWVLYLLVSEKSPAKNYTSAGDKGMQKLKCDICHATTYPHA